MGNKYLSSAATSHPGTYIYLALSDVATESLSEGSFMLPTYPTSLVNEFCYKWHQLATALSLVAHRVTSVIFDTTRLKIRGEQSESWQATTGLRESR